MYILMLFSVLMITFEYALPCAAPAFNPPENETQWHISADSATYDHLRELYVARGGVVISGGQTRLHADYVEFNNATRDASASGHVLLISGEDTVTCDALTLNLETRRGTIHQGTIFIQENNFYIKGDRLEKTGKDTYRADRASITTCPGDDPDWKISAKDITVTIEGYGTAKNAVLWAKKMPAMYTPFLSFPVKTKRQTGLLSPRISSSKRKGFEYEQPLYMALSRGSDATLYGDYMTDRGLKGALEYRYVTNNGSKGSLYWDYLDDREIDDGSPETKDYRYGSTPMRTNSDRYWLRMKHDQIITDTWNARLDIDLVSDADYLHEFKEGYTGFKSTNKYYGDYFGRSLDDYDDTIRKNTLIFNRTAFNYTASMGLNWYDNVIARQDNLQDTTIQNLPFFEISTAKQSIANSWLYFDMDGEYRNFYRQDTTDSMICAQRADIFPRAYVPLRLGSFYLEPSVGIRETFWYKDGHETKKIDENALDYNIDNDNIYKGDDFEQRSLYTFNTTLSTRLSRIFNPRSRFAQKIKHDIVPKIEYGWISHSDSDEFPFFDSVDKIENQSLFTWTLTNRFTSKTQKGAAPSPGSKEIISSPVYREFAWFELSQSFDVHRERNNLENPFSDIYAQIELSPFGTFALRSDAKWSPYENNFTSYNTGITLTVQRGDSVYAAYRYEREESESFYTKINTKITTSLNAFAAYEQNLFENETIESQTGINFHTPCWSLLVSYTDTPDDSSIAFLVNLYGIGEFGKK